MPACRVEIRPNRSLSPRGLTGLLVVFGALSLIIGVGFMWAGAWLVLPFFGLEFAVVAAVVVWLKRHRDDHEAVIVDGNRLDVIRVEGNRETRHEFPRYWARTSLRRDRAGWYASRLLVGAHGHWLEIGRELSEERREALWQRIEAALSAEGELNGTSQAGRLGGRT